MVAPEDDDEASKTEEPSERKIEKAKEEGDTAISQDAKSFIMFLAMLAVVWMVIPLMFRWFYGYSIKFIEMPENIPMDAAHLQRVFISAAVALLKILSIPFVIFIVFGVAASISQTGFIYAPKKLAPNWNKLNIFAALPNFINMRKVVESNKNYSYKNDVNTYKLRDKRSEVYIWESSPQTCTLTGLSYIPKRLFGCKCTTFYQNTKAMDNNFTRNKGCHNFPHFVISHYQDTNKRFPGRQIGIPAGKIPLCQVSNYALP